MDSRARSDRLVDRATFGARPGDRERARAQGPEAWFEDQVRRGLARRLRGFSGLDLSPGDALPDMGRRGDPADPAKRRERRRQLRELGRHVVGARVVRAVHGERGLFEVMVDFWSNHFSVFARKSMVAALLPDYERRVLERHALGRFEDLLLASARSPAMLVYLDNWNSTTPRGIARMRVGKGGINENYARELLELHTLGVDGGYTQQDVIETARVLTGWTLESRRNPEFRFRDRVHDRGSKVVLGQRVPGSGVGEGENLLRRLAAHPSTARHVSRKLAVRFVGDDPPDTLIEDAARIWRSTGGDIPAVLREILLSDAFADPARKKMKTPLRFLTSALRATGGETDGRRPVLAALGRLGELPFLARTPAGHPEAASAWADPGAALERMNLAFALAQGQVRGTRLGAASPPGQARVASLAPRDRLAVALAAPEFQWT